MIDHIQVIDGDSVLLVVTEDEACISGHEFRGPSVYCKSGPVLYINGQAL